ncbi:MAG TPA: S1 RNA-binding domain-containing protein, partial [Spirochaetota bacterium]|nr:S1 RNA-binding domain-containing protein [Spirochaetota bacterium]
GRREIGHGMLAEKSLQPMIPDDFPYTIRTVSEIMESNGSSSMATICASTMSLMAAGVPLKNPVAGIAMGLIIEDKKYKILTDIQGMEDHLGDMDFKVAGTAKGITGFQLDIKVEGINREIMAQALEQAKTARMQILENMGKAISEPRKEMNPNIPRLETISIPEEKVKILIGPSGKTIKSIVAETGSKIDIADNGEVNIFAQDQAALQNTIKIIESHVGVPRLNKVYDGVVKKIMPFGAFIEIMPHTDGLCHISQIANERVNNVSDYLKEGDKVKAKVIKIDNNGKISLTCKNLPPVSQ